ncbi:MAG: hypothetical protein P9L99_15820 [Candidatus Lernaella stagnicola]|nr:hypothetical protein [Candidatus Lernaella stagnicola]
MKRRWLVRLAYGAILGLLAVGAASPRLASPGRVKQAMEAAIYESDDRRASRLLPLFIDAFEYTPLELTRLGQRLGALNEPAVVEQYAALVEESVAPTDPIRATALLWRAEAAVMGRRPREARRLYEEVLEKYWDHPQALEAQSALRRLVGRDAAARITQAALDGQWERVVDLAAEIDATTLFPEDRDLIAAHLLEAYLATARLDAAVEKLRRWAAADSGYNIPSILMPSRLAPYEASRGVVGRARDNLTDERWRIEMSGLEAALGDRWQQVRTLLPAMDSQMALNLVEYGLRQAIDDVAAEGLLEALPRERFSDVEKLHGHFLAANFWFSRGNVPRADAAIRAGLDLQLDEPEFGHLQLLRLELDDVDPGVALKRYGELARRWTAHERLLLEILRFGQKRLAAAGRRGEACRLGREYAEALLSAGHRQGVLEFCDSP